MPKKLTDKEVKKRLKNRFKGKIECLDTYKNFTASHRFKCVCGNIWTTKYVNIFYSTYGCPKCALKSLFKGNRYLKHRVIPNCTKIIITNREGKVVGRALIDPEDKKLCKNYTWVLDAEGYVVSTTTGKTVRLHRLITNCPENKEVDHKKHNLLDNRKSQLRVCSRQENGRNLKITSRNKSGYKGVHLKKSGEYSAKIKVNNKDKRIGVFKTATEAARAYNKAAKKYYGEFAKLNKIKGSKR